MNKSVPLVLLLAGAMCLTACTGGKSSGGGKQEKETASGKTDAGQKIVEDTHQTEYGTELGTELFTEADGLIVEDKGDEESRIIQDKLDPSSMPSGTPDGSAGKEGGMQSALFGGSDIDGYLSSRESETETDSSVYEEETETEDMLHGSETESESVQDINAADEKEPFAAFIDQIESRENQGEKWSLAVEALSDGSQYGYKESEKMQSASVIKLFIMGAVYQYMCYPESDEEMINFGESYSGELRDTISKMITVSDNDAANLLVEKLGEGSFEEGEKKIAEFCGKYGYTQTSVGRRFMESGLSGGDNYTSADDVRKFYSDIYHGKLVNEEASGKMLDIIKQQTLKNKIPAGLPEDFTSGNKTGEMPDGYGLGCIENDSAIVFPPEASGKEGYILVVLSNDLGGRNSEAQSFITRISSDVASWYMKSDL